EQARCGRLALMRVRPEQFEVAPLPEAQERIGRPAPLVTAAIDRFHCGEGVDVLDQLGEVRTGVDNVVALDRHAFEATWPPDPGERPTAVLGIRPAQPGMRR